MSAIFGILRFDGGEVSSRDLERMANTLAHRGPDGRRSVGGGVVGLGHCLLRVNQEDLFEAQPLCDREADLTLVADCRIDNRETLATAFGIGAAELRDMPDSALVLQAYKKWGEDCAEQLLGDFAFAIWDGRRRTLLLGRDHMGQRCQFYHHGKDFIAFATEIRALWALGGVPHELSADQIGKSLLNAVDISTGKTLFDGIGLLPGGTTLRVEESGAATLRRYWEPRAAAEHLGRDEAHYLAAYREVLEEAVACRVRRLTRPPALCFSGGFDSGSIAALAGPIVAARKRKIIAVASVLEEGETRMVRDARAAVEAFRVFPFLDIRYFIRRDETIFADIEESFAMVDGAGGTRYVKRGLFRIAAAAGARLVLDGHGGDYTVNVRAGHMLGRMLRRGKLRRFAREFRMRMRATRRSGFEVLRQDVVPALLPLNAIAAVFSLRRKSAQVWLERPINEALARDLFARGAADPARLRVNYPVYNRWRDRWLHLLRRFSASTPAHAQLAAAHGMDLSRPFHDKRIVELGLALPEDLQFRNGLERYLARRTLGALLPARLLASGPGNDAEDPDMFRAANGSAAQALAEVRKLDHDGRLSRFFDLDKLGAMLAGVEETRKADHFRLSLAANAIAMARFVAWFERSND
ncbi:MAG: asparagine synthase-related protein [Rhizomicrobium sp.]